MRRAISFSSLKSDSMLTMSEPTTSIKHAVINGTRLAYLECGEGEPVVFVHGALSDYRAWTSQIEALSGNYKVIAYSRRYHYPNEFADNGAYYSRSLHAKDLVAFLKTLNLGAVHLVGYSYGGAIAAAVASEQPALVRSLVLCEPGILSLLEDKEYDTLAVTQQTAFKEVLKQLKSGDTDAAIKDYLKIAFGADLISQMPDAARVVVSDNARTLEPMLKTFYVAPPFNCEQARKLRMPALLVTGTSSPKIYKSIIEKLWVSIFDSQLLTLDASHALQIEKPQEFNKGLLEFLQSQKGMNK